MMRTRAVRLLPSRGGWASRLGPYTRPQPSSTGGQVVVVVPCDNATGTRVFSILGC